LPAHLQLEEEMIRAGFAILVGSIFAVAAAAQAQTSSQVPAPSNPSAQAETQGATLPNGPAINAALNSSVDSKKAKVGDKVEAHTTDAMLDDGKEIVPKGAKLEGHVTEATARSKGDNGSTLAIQFDKAIPKKGEEISLNVLIVAVAPPQNDFSGSAGPGNDPMGNRGAAAAGGSPMGGSRPQNPTSGTPSYPTTGSSDGSPETNGPGRLPANSRGVYGLKDLKLMMNKSSTGQTTVITSDGKNVHLDGGTRLLLVVQAQTAAAAAPSK
jgi:hypothetical protein